MKRLSFIIIVLLACFGNSYAENKLQVEDITIAPGKTAQLNIEVSNPDAQYTAIQADLYLPEGIDLVVEDENYKYSLNRVTESHSLSIGKMTGFYRLILSSSKSEVITGTSGKVISLTVKADVGLTEGSIESSLKSIKLAKTDGSGQIIDQLTFVCKIVNMPSNDIVTIGGKGLTTFTSKYNLDFSGFGDEVKAYVATGYDYDTKTIWLTRVKDVPAGTALMVKGAAGKTYEVPVKESSGSYYKNMFVGNTTGSDMVLSETSDGMTNYYLKDGEFLSVKGSANIPDGKSYLQIPTAAPTAKAGSSQTMTMNDYGFASYCGSQDLDFTDVEGLKAYAATGYDDATGTIWLTRVMRVSARTPLLLMGAPSTEDKVSSYTVPSSAVSSYYTNMLKGNTSSEQLVINPTDGEMTNYYLRGNQLLKVNGTAKINPGKAYMQIPTKAVTRAEEDVVSGAPYYNIGEEPEVISMQIGTRGIDGDDADTTGISEVKSDDADRGEWYNLQGQRVGNPGKGLYIKNGKKVIVR